MESRLRLASTALAALLLMPLAHAQFKLFVLPVAPVSPTSQRECELHGKKVAEVVQSIEAAHESCLANAQRDTVSKQLGIKTYSMRSLDSESDCSNPQCQSLHDRRSSFRNKGEKAVSECSASVAKYQRDEAQKTVRQQQRDQLNSTAKDVAITGAAGVVVKGAATGVMRGAGQALGNPVTGTLQPFLDPENAKNIYDATAAQRREGRTNSRNVYEAKQLEELERLERLERGKK